MDHSIKITYSKVNYTKYIDTDSRLDSAFVDELELSIFSNLFLSESTFIEESWDSVSPEIDSLSDDSRVIRYYYITKSGVYTYIGIDIKC